LVIITTTLLESDTTELFLTSCDVGEVGITEELLTNIAGCDSLVIITTTLLESDTTELFLTSCNVGDVGVTEELLTNSIGCDSLVITTTTFLESDTTELFLTSCDVSEVGTTEELLINSSGCDSLVIITTTLLESDTTELFLTSCDVANVGTTEELLTNSAGCDSLVITTTTFLESDTTALFLTSCDASEVGITEDLLTNSAGCDSLVITTTTFLESDTTELVLTSCEASGVGTIEELFTNSAGCDSLVITEVIYEPLIGTVETIDICEGTSFTWNGLALTSAGQYETLLQTASGCDSIAQLSLNTFEPILELLASATEIKLGEEVTLTTETNLLNTDYEWVLGGADTVCICPTLTLEPLRSSVYEVAVFDEQGCTATDEVQIAVDERVGLYLPNAFSPNNDGFNDSFFPQGNADQFPIVKLFRVFDRWGGLMFERNNIGLNNPTDGWNGQWRGQALNTGVYIYYIEAERKDGEVYKAYGDVLLSR
ncbi:MAG: gliding motility-associated C-terminal domain-containing protein, partial [Bacteroidota bacterium]